MINYYKRNISGNTFDNDFQTKSFSFGNYHSFLFYLLTIIKANYSTIKKSTCFSKLFIEEIKSFIIEPYFLLTDVSKCDAVV